MQINGIRVHESLTAEVLAEAYEGAMTSLDNPGFCILCGCEADGCEPDAERYHCENCGADQVYGAEQLILYTAI